MKSILKKVTGVAVVVTLALGMLSCSNDSTDTPVALPDSTKETVATPAFSVASGEVENGTNVAISCTTEGAKIYYTIDGTEPESSSTEYTTAISVTSVVTIKAIAVKDGMNDSAVASAFYILKIPEFPFIPAGTFIMGSNKGGNANKPAHSVTLTKAFYICDHEVTQAEYEIVTGTNPSGFDLNDENHQNRPVEQVSWYMAIVYCNKRSIAENLVPCYTISGETNPDLWGEIPTGENDATWDAVTCNWNANGYRLPTEAEWEYAAKAGDATLDSLVYSGTNVESSLRDYAWYRANENQRTHVVKTKKANAFGLYDMSGNVSEWCWDWWPASGAYSADAATDPCGDATGTKHVFRDGDYSNWAAECAVTCRNSSFPYFKSNGIGFRVVRTAN